MDFVQFLFVNTPNSWMWSIIVWTRLPKKRLWKCSRSHRIHLGKDRLATPKFPNSLLQIHFWGDARAARHRGRVDHPDHLLGLGHVLLLPLLAGRGGVASVWPWPAGVQPGVERGPSDQPGQGAEQEGSLHWPATRYLNCICLYICICTQYNMNHKNT